MKQISLILLLFCVAININYIVFCENSFSVNNFSVTSSGPKNNNSASDEDNTNRDNELSGSGDDEYDYDDEDYGDDHLITPVVTAKTNVSAVESSGDNSVNNSLAENDNNRTKDFSFDDLRKTVANRIYENLGDSLRNRFVDLYYDTISSLKLSPMCHNSTVRVLEGIYHRKMWAIKFIDSFGGWPSGLADGVLYSFGEYDECLDIRSGSDETIDIAFAGQYCLAKPHVPLLSFDSLKNGYFASLNLSQSEEMNKLVTDFGARIDTIKIMSAYSGTEFSPFQVGVCVPSTCDVSDIEEAVNKLVYPVLRIPVQVGPQCSVKSEKTTLNNYQLTAILCLSFISTLVIISTVIEIFYSKLSKNDVLNRNNNNNAKTDKNWESYAFSFSAISNTRKLFSTRDRLHSVDTILLAFVVWICLAQYLQSPITTNLIGVKRALHSVAMQTLDATKYFWVRIPFPVDTVFLISGVVIAYDFFGRKHETHIIRLLFVCYPKFVIEKWLRFAVRTIGPIFVIYLLSAFGDGPVWPIGYQFLVEPCQSRYHHNLFFYNNYAPNVTNSCNRPSLYLSIIFQLQVISPLIMIPLLISPVVGVVFNVLMLCISSIVCVLPRVLNDTKLVPYEVSRIDSIDDIRYSFARYYFYADQHLIPFIIGIIAGYLIRNEVKHKLLFINRMVVKIILSCLSIALIVSTIIWTENIHNVSDENYDNIVYWLPITKLMWCSAIFWFIYALCTDRIGSLNRVLSARYLKPVARLSLGFLLYNSIVIYFRIFNRKENYDITKSYLIQFIYIDLTATLLLTYAMYISLECPINNWISLLMTSKRYTKANSHYNAVVNCTNNNSINRRCDDEMRQRRHKNIFKRDDSVEIKFMFPGD